MLIADYIAVNGADAAARVLRAAPAFRIFNLCWNAPEEILPACKALGIATVADLQQWANTVNPAIGADSAFCNLVNPAVDLDPLALPVIQWPHIHEAAFLQCKLAADLQLHHSDLEYRLPSKAQWEMLAATCPSIRRRHSGSDAHDCDDFVKHFLGWLAGKGLGNLAAGFCATRHYLDANLVSGHAVALVLDDTRTVWQVEPQNGKLYAANYPKLGGALFANRVEIARLYF